MQVDGAGFFVVAAEVDVGLGREGDASVKRGPLVVEIVVEAVVVEVVVVLGVRWWAGLAVVYHQRLWNPQPSRPLSWLVTPPSLQATMWSPWQRSAGTKQVP